MTQVMSSINNAFVAQSATRAHGIALAQKAMGLAIFGSGLAVIVGQALQRALAG